jgi:phosphate transport system substrate-binding protein
VLIPIRFDTGSTMVDVETRANVEVLASALGSPDYKAQRFVFVGHADARGSESENLVLSKRRAEAIYQSVIILQPSLTGRIEIIGRGSSEPLDPGNTESAWRKNRRLQVLLK